MGVVELTLGLQLSHATEAGAMATAGAAGYGDKNRADHEAVKAMREHLIRWSLWSVVIGGRKGMKRRIYILAKM